VEEAQRTNVVSVQILGNGGTVERRNEQEAERRRIVSERFRYERAFELLTRRMSSLPFWEPGDEQEYEQLVAGGYLPSLADLAWVLERKLWGLDVDTLEECSLDFIILLAERVREVRASVGTEQPF
jgi:hypothetical protein